MRSLALTTWKVIVISYLIHSVATDYKQVKMNLNIIKHLKLFFTNTMTAHVPKQPIRKILLSNIEAVKEFRHD